MGVGISIRVILILALAVVLSSCASAKVKQITADNQACMSAIETQPEYIVAHVLLYPDGGTTPSMLANNTYPTKEHLKLFAAYLDQRTICARRLLSQSGEISAVRNDERYEIAVRQTDVLVQLYATLLTGQLTYADYFADHQEIKNATMADMGRVERRVAAVKAEASRRQTEAMQEMWRKNGETLRNSDIVPEIDLNSGVTTCDSNIVGNRVSTTCNSY